TRASLEAASRSPRAIPPVPPLAAGGKPSPPLVDLPMSSRPSGTVTFPFTDVEGSTQLWEQHHSWMEAAHRRHEAILREAIAAHGGYAYKQIGDAFQAAFQTAADALAAAVDAQRALAAGEQPADEQLVVRGHQTV